MNETMKSLQYPTKAIDVQKEGIVTVAVNGIGIEDNQHDISMPGSFARTLGDMRQKRWFLNHDSRLLLGCPISGEEKDGNVIMTGKMNLNKQIARDTFTDYELYAECGRTLEHSIGVLAVKRDTADRRKVLEWDMKEYSTLTAWGANPQTFLVGLKSGSADQIREAADIIRKALTMRGYSDERLKSYDMELDLLLKSLNGGAIVACPCCGYQFDYDSVPEHTFTSMVRDAALDWLTWQSRRMAEEELAKLSPEIRQQVVAIIDSMKGRKADLTEKSITDALSFVRCPNCYSKVYRSNSILTPEAAEDPAEGEKQNIEEPAEAAETAEKSADAPVSSFWTKLNNSISTH